MRPAFPTLVLLAGLLVVGCTSSRSTQTDDLRGQREQNLQHILLACRQIAIDDIKQGKYPPDLRALILNSDLTAQSVMYPPRRAPTFDSPEADAEWAQENSDYVYLGGGLNDSVWADVILAHENPERTGSPNEIGVAYADGSFAFLPPVAFEKALLRHSIYRAELARRD